MLIAVRKNTDKTIILPNFRVRKWYANSNVSTQTVRNNEYTLLLVSAKNAEGMKEHRQAVECQAQNP